MASTHAERVVPAQSTALMLEELGLGMHCGVLVLFGDAPDPDDVPLDVERVHALLERTLPAVPHGRQRVRHTPVEREWIWTDDERFNLHYHLRHTRLPRPGDERQLKRLVGRLMSERLDRNRPLWEAWLIEGIADARFALMLKLHAGALEGAAIPELLDAIGQLDAAAALPPAPAWRARPAPAAAELLAGSAVRWSGKPRDLLEQVRETLGHPREALQVAAGIPVVGSELLREALGGAARTALNPRRIGGHRRVEVLRLRARECARVAAALSAPIADVALSVLAGGLESFLGDRGDKPEMPVIQTVISLPAELGASGGPSTVRIALPLGIADPVERVIEVGRARLAAETGPRAAAHDVLERLESWIPPSIQRAVQATGRRSGNQLGVEFVTAPAQLPSLLGAPARSVVLFAPLRVDQGLGVGVVQTSQQLSFGFNSDWDLFPDLHELVTATERCFAQLCARLQEVDPVPTETARERRLA